MKNNRKILIIGGSGFIGRNIAQKLDNLGYEIYLLQRNKSNQKTGPLPYKIIQGDIVKKNSFKISPDIYAIINCAGVLGGWNIPDKLFWDVNVAGTKNLIDQAIKSKVKKFVQISSAGVYGPLPNGVIASEKSPYNPSNIYELTKCESEKYVLNQKDKIITSVINPEFVYGPGDLHVLGLFQLINKGVFPVFGGGQSLLHPTYIDDLVVGVIEAMNSNKSGQKYIIAGQKSYRVREIGLMIGEVLGKKPKIINIPIIITKILAFICELSARVFKIKPPLTLAQIRFFTQNRAFSTKKAQQELGWQPKFTYQEGLKITIDWYKTQGLL